jgi:YggT family protein
VTQVVCATLNVYTIILFARAILTWFPVRPDTGLASVQHVLVQLTEPVLAPVRRVIPPAGMFDLSFIVVLFAIIILHGLLGCTGTIF